MKLELKHLAPYLPYSVRFIECYQSSFSNQPDTINNYIMRPENMGVLYGKKRYRLKSAKLILHLLSDLTKEIEVNGERFVPIDELYKMSDYSECIPNIEEDVYQSNTPKRWPYEIFEKLLEWHFDVFRLIDQDLAININTL